MAIVRNHNEKILSDRDQMKTLNVTNYIAEGENLDTMLSLRNR